MQLEVKVTAQQKEIWSLVAIGRVTWHQGNGCAARELKLKSNGWQECDAREDGGFGENRREDCDQQCSEAELQWRCHVCEYNA
ncbi:hypothetical protein [Paraburkholderia sp. RL18-085-BIA-A]|uniref:hypothetical protein n=1 Tax=Paraburkholderia sp. RL18-085-BIA-A TaxID=3031633 RepID=UPI0038B9E55D